MDPDQLADQPRNRRWLEPLPGCFAPRIAAYDLPEMKSYMADHPDTKVALDQPAYARGWFSTSNVVGVRKALKLPE